MIASYIKDEFNTYSVQLLLVVVAVPNGFSLGRLNPFVSESPNTKHHSIFFSVDIGWASHI